MQRIVTINEEIYTHEYLWRSSSTLADRLDVVADDQYHLFSPTLLTTFMAYEAFINFCGLVILPDLWSNEKNAFVGKTLEDKLQEIINVLPTFVWRKDSRPYQTIKKLSTFRNLVTHGKVQTNQYEAEPEPDGGHFRFSHAWDNLLTHKAVNEARSDVKAFCQELLEGMRNNSDHPHLASPAFEGSLASGKSSSNVG